MEGLSFDVTERLVGNPECDGLDYRTFIVSYTNDVFKSFNKFLWAVLVSHRWHRLDAVYAVKGEIKNLVGIESRAEKVPSAVIFLKQVGMDKH